MALAFVVDTQNFTVMVSDLGDMPTWSVLEAPAARKVQSILQNREYRNKAVLDSPLCSFLHSTEGGHAVVSKNILGPQRLPEA